MSKLRQRFLERLRIRSWYCQDCGGKLDESYHHYLCNYCYNKRKELM